MMKNSIIAFVGGLALIWSANAFSRYLWDEESFPQRSNTPVAEETKKGEASRVPSNAANKSNGVVVVSRQAVEKVPEPEPVQ